MPGLSRAEERLIRGLLRRGRRGGERLFIAEGIRVVEELLAAECVRRLTVVSSSLGDTERGRALADRLVGDGVVRTVTDGELKRLAGTRSPQGVLVVAEMPAVDLFGLEPSPAARVLALDAVQDPGNIGTLARCAAAFGCELLACLPGTVDPWNAKAVRASAGALFRLPVIESDPDELWDWTRRHDFVALGADAAGEPLDRTDRPARAVLVVGNEGAGLSAGVRERCDRLVGVPMRQGVGSLNVAVAAGILLYELTRGAV